MTVKCENVTVKMEWSRGFEKIKADIQTSPILCSQAAYSFADGSLRKKPSWKLNDNHTAPSSAQAKSYNKIP